MYFLCGRIIFKCQYLFSEDFHTVQVSDISAASNEDLESIHFMSSFIANLLLPKPTNTFTISTEHNTFIQKKLLIKCR